MARFIWMAWRRGRRWWRAVCGSPCTCMPVFRDCEVTLPRPLPAREGRSVAEALFRDGLCLPSGAAMSEADLARVVEVVRGVRR